MAMPATSLVTGTPACINASDEAHTVAIEDEPFANVPEKALKVVSDAVGSEDSLEARRAFNEKHKPQWKGR